MTSETHKIRVAAVADIHCHESNLVAIRSLLASLSGAADILLLCGDLTDTGSEAEAEMLATELKASVRTPIVAVLGNHDCESNRPQEVKRILSDAGVCMLDGTSCTVGGVGFAGVKGFCGGFGRYQLQAWGETVLKNFVHEVIDEELKLENALVHLGEVPRVVLLHYSPILSTVEGEPTEIFPFLGSSRLEGPIDRFGASVVFHGHAHHGRPEGRTAGDIPVYNVSMPVLQAAHPDHPPFRTIDIMVRTSAEEVRPA
jgi:Icc-related predicted phosphoesterase